MLFRLLPALAVSLALSLLLEGGYALIWGLRGRRDWLLLLLANVVTNPIVVIFYHLGLDSWPAVAALELGAVLAEGLAYRRWSGEIRKPFLFSLCANCFSFFSGLLLQYFR